MRLLKKCRMGLTVQCDLCCHCHDLKGSGTLSIPKCLSKNHIVSMWNNFAYPCTMFSRKVFHDRTLYMCKTEKVSTHFHVSQLLVISLYSLTKSVPDPLSTCNRQLNQAISTKLSSWRPSPRRRRKNYFCSKLLRVNSDKGQNWPRRQNLDHLHTPLSWGG